MNRQNKLKIAISTAAMGLAMGASGLSLAESSEHEQGTVSMKADAQYKNQSADKASIFHDVKDDAEQGSEQSTTYSSETQDNQNYDQEYSSEQYDQEYSAEDEVSYSTSTNETMEMSEAGAMDKTLHFQFDSTELTQESQETLDSIQQELSDASMQAEVKIVGYTDTSGPEAYNQHLSKERAEAIKNKLQNTNLEVTEWEVKGEGESNPLADNDTREGRAENRRVELQISTQAEDQISSANQF